MKRRASNTQTPRVNILKKINVNGAWKLMPSALESNGQIENRVRINGNYRNLSWGDLL